MCLEENQYFNKEKTPKDDEFVSKKDAKGRL